MSRRPAEWRALRPLALALALLLSAAVAQPSSGASGRASEPGWTVQVVALRDLREAEGVAAQLAELGFDAYTEFAMHQDQQYIRVRVGCFRTRAGARDMAAVLTGHVTREAVVQPRTDTAAPRGCSERVVGFLKPERWRQLRPQGAGFEVQVAERSALVVHDGSRWTLQQDADAPPAAAAAPAPAGRFHQGRVAGRPMVMVEYDGRTVALCPGRLLARAGDAALVEQDAAVVACHYHPPDARSTAQHSLGSR